MFIAKLCMSASIVVSHDVPYKMNYDGSTPVLAQNIGIETLGDVETVLLDQGCILPCEKSHTFSTANDHQNEIMIKMYQGVSSMASKNKSLGKVILGNIADANAETPSIRVIFRVQVNAITVSAFDEKMKSRITLRHE